MRYKLSLFLVVLILFQMSVIPFYSYADNQSIVANGILKSETSWLEELSSFISKFIDMVQNYHLEEPDSIETNEELEDVVHFSTGKTRLIQINCPVNIEVYDEDGNLVAWIENDELPDLDTVLSYGINYDNEKFVYLPSDGNYTIKMIATNKGNVNVNIAEEISFEGVVRLINYYDIPITKGAVLLADIPAYTKEDIKKDGASTTIYKVFNKTDGKEISLTNEIVGEDIEHEYYYHIKVRSNDEMIGFVSGSGSRLLGTYALLTAYPSKEAVFEGWYENDKKISDKREYKIRVEKKREIIGKFRKIDNAD